MTHQSKHPAKFSIPILKAIISQLWLNALVLDPFAGVGRLAWIPNIRSVCVELQPRWATHIVGNALCLPFVDHTFDICATSPTYGNRFADHHNAQDGSVRHSYTHDYGEALHCDNSGVLQWGDEYRQFHVAAWTEITRCTQQRLVLNVSDHIRKRKRQYVSEFHAETLCSLGWRLTNTIEVPTARMRYGENHTERVDCEYVFTFDA